MGNGRIRPLALGLAGLLLVSFGHVSTADAHRGRGYVAFGYGGVPGYSVFAARPFVTTYPSAVYRPYFAPYVGYYPGSYYYGPRYAGFGAYAGPIGYPTYARGYYPPYAVYRPAVVRGPMWYGAPVTVTYRGRVCRGFCF